MFFSEYILPSVAINDSTISNQISFPTFNDHMKWIINHIPVIQELFIVKSRLGKGTFGHVYLASLRDCPEKSYALKHILPVSAAQRIENEIKCLTLLKGCDNIISLETFFRYNGHIILLMPFIEHDKLKDFISTLTVHEVRAYMKALFNALVSVHKLGIIHRDIKPSNCLYNSKKNKLMLIDFGLAQIENELQFTNKRFDVVKHELSVNCCSKYDKCQHLSAEICNTCLHKPIQMSPRGGTPGFRAPEVLLKYPNQTTSIDIWSAGIIFLCFLSGKYPFFKASNDHVAMMEIVTLFGSQKCITVAKLLNKEFTCSPIYQTQSLANICESLRRSRPDWVKQDVYHVDNSKVTPAHIVPKQMCPIKSNSSVTFHASPETFCPSQSGTSNVVHLNFAPTLAYDLLEKCLDLNPFTRITASQALQHPFFRQ